MTEITTDLDGYLSSEYPAQIAEAERLCSVEDPEETPYKSRYAAVEILQGIESKLLAYQSSYSSSPILPTIIALARLRIGIINLETEENYHAEQHITQALDTLEQKWPANCLQVLEGLNNMGILWNNRTEYSKAEEYLTRAEKLYHSLPPDSPLEDEDKQPGLRDKLEAQHTRTLFYLAQVFGYSKEITKSAQYCLKTLQRQLSSGAYDPLEWSKYALSIALYYTLEDMLEHAKQCLQAASWMVTAPDPVHTANVCLGWGKVFAQQLTNSAASTKLVAGQAISASAHDDDDLCLFDMNRIIDSGWHSFLPISIDKVSMKMVRSLDEARKVFDRGMVCLRKAHEYYVLDGYVSDYFSIVEDMCMLYGGLLVFETSPDAREKNFRDRIALLEPLSDQLSTEHFHAMLQQINFTLGELYVELYELIVKVMTQTKDQSPAMAKKINSILTRSTKHFQLFIKSFEKRNKQDPSKPGTLEIDPDNMEAYVTARMHLGKLYSKVITPQPPVMAKYLQAAMEQYKWVHDYARQNPGTKADEFASVAGQMAELMPMMIAKVLTQS
eukprot:TRINITY_DN7188_c0_g1_i1.p1 TRINITY_DN7188_c0_g1~~TRINITY_DN7188_c0_g1_i1.p1  ORF type:complete len:556 (+),score=149.45 TRINITY_DN7188_c0_g1_i1:2-1669(+)